MQITEEQLSIPVVRGHTRLLEYFSKSVAASLPAGSRPIRFVVSKTDEFHYDAEVGVLVAPEDDRNPPSIFEFRRRTVEHEEEFNAALLIPTGIGAEIGGHAGDATP